LVISSSLDETVMVWKIDIDTNCRRSDDGIKTTPKARNAMQIPQIEKFLSSDMALSDRKPSPSLKPTVNGNDNMFKEVVSNGSGNLYYSNEYAIQMGGYQRLSSPLSARFVGILQQPGCSDIAFCNYSIYGMRRDTQSGS